MMYIECVFGRGRWLRTERSLRAGVTPATAAPLKTRLHCSPSYRLAGIDERGARDCCSRG